MSMKLYEEADIQNLANIIREKNGTSETYSISQMDDAVSDLNNFSGDYNDLTNKPTLGTASPKDVAVSGNASSTQVVMGNDTRLTDRRGSTWGQINGTLANQTDLKNSIDSLQGQIDAFTALTDGSTTGDAELTNIRVDSTGHTYPTAGDAVRAIDSQVNAMKTGFDGVVYNSPAAMVQGCDQKLQDEIDDINDTVFATSTNLNDEVYEFGGIWAGADYPNNKLARTKNFLPVTTGATLKAFGKYGDNANINSLQIEEYDSTMTYKRQGALYVYPAATGYSWTLGNDTAYIRFAIGDQIDDLDLSLLKISVYYSADYVAGYTPHLVPAWDNGDNLPERGLVISNGSYIHFTKIGTNNYICREFKPLFVNNLIDLYKIYYGSYVNGTIAQSTAVGTSSSDTIGPISICRGEIDGYAGQWSGGGHGKTISEVEYPTAEEESLKVYCGGVEVSANGTYFGDVTIKEVNSLYFPQTVTGSDLSGATKAFTETRIIRLTDKMNVKIYLKSEYEAPGPFVVSYYGCQCNTFNMQNVELPNNETLLSLPLSTTYFWDEKETAYFCSNADAHYDVELKPIGLGLFKYNDGTSDAKWGNVANFNKIYYQLIKGARIASGKSIMWEADYKYYHD